MTVINSARLLEVVAKSVGPAPWQWQTFPILNAASGRRFTWTHHGEQGALAHLITLSAEDEPEKPRLALNTYCRPFLVPPALLGIWCPEGPNIRLLYFDLDKLKPFDLAEIAGWFKQSSERIYAATAPLDEVEVSLQLPSGMNEINFPSGLQTVTELIVPTPRNTKSVDDPAFALYIFYPHAGLLEVLPQKWFTQAQYDIGYQWITRAIRDPESLLIAGECFRAGRFLLPEGGCSLDRWLDKTG